MRIFDIIGETADTWETRHAQFRRQQTKLTKLRGKISRATSASYQHHRRAADQAARDHDKIADAKRDLTSATKPTCDPTR